MSFSKDKEGKQRGGHPRFYQLLDEIADLHARKNNNYSADSDPLSNLRFCESFGVPATTGVMVRLGDKFSRLCQLMQGKKDLVGESIKDTLMDNAIYSLLEIILIEEEAKKK